MSSALATALFLQCLFGQAAPGSAPADVISSLRVPVPAELAGGFKDNQPPPNTYVFAGEEAVRREWVFVQRPAAGGSDARLLRLDVSDDPFFPSTYQARFGSAAKAADGSYKFTQISQGTCELEPAKGTQQ